jgi:hypothetical protein
MKILAHCCVLAAALAFSGCDLLDKADDVTFDAVIQVDWVADENADGTNVVYTQSETLELASNAEIEKYQSKIKEIKITKITYAIADYNAAPHNSAVIFSNGVASFFALGSSVPVGTAMYAASATGVNLQTTTSETDLIIDADALSEVAGVLKADKQIVMTTNGILSQTPVSFRVVSKFYVTITANALD